MVGEGEMDFVLRRLLPVIGIAASYRLASDRLLRLRTENAFVALHVFARPFSGMARC